MSIEVMALVMRRAMGSATRKAVMLAMADAANEDGCGIWKSADTIAAQSEISKRTVLRVWQELESEGVIHRKGTRPVRGGEVIIWDIDIRKVSALPKAVSAPEKPGDTVSPGDTDATDPVTLTPRPGDTVSPNTSLTRPIEPSSARAPALELISESDSPEPPDDRFEEAWQLYNSTPLKAGQTKKLAKAQWPKAVTRAGGADRIIAAIRVSVEERLSPKRFIASLPDMHRWLAQDRWQDVLVQPEQPTLTPADERLLNLERCFYQYGSGGAWRGREFGEPLKPDEAPAGHYPAELYAKYGLKPLGPAPDQSSEEAA